MVPFQQSQFDEQLINSKHFFFSDLTFQLAMETTSSPQEGEKIVGTSVPLIFFL